MFVREHIPSDPPSAKLFYRHLIFEEHTQTMFCFVPKVQKCLITTYVHVYTVYTVGLEATESKVSHIYHTVFTVHVCTAPPMCYILCMLHVHIHVYTEVHVHVHVHVHKEYFLRITS